jgi:hypothetical protein
MAASSTGVPRNLVLGSVVRVPKMLRDSCAVVVSGSGVEAGCAIAVVFCWLG